MSTETVAKEIWDAVKRIGGTDEVAAGLLGNAEQESGINPKAGANGDDWAYGIFQFEFGTSEYTGFISYCNKKGYKPDTSKAQLSYLFVDGNGSNGYAEHLFNVSPRNGYVGHYSNGAQYGYSPHIEWKDYLKLKDIEKATRIWELVYEAASLPMMENRIKYAKQWYSKFKGTYTGPVEGGSDSGSGLVAHVEKLYSSQNYSYIETLKDTSTSFEKNIKKEFSNIIRNVIETRKEQKNSKPLVSILKDTVLDFVSINNALKTVDNSYDLRIESDISGSPLPVINEPVEAPYFEVKIGGVAFGGYKGRKVPNYVKALTAKKINNSFNEYNIKLIHQISPGDNPNYIDEIISSVKYDVINLKYGNANTGQIFSDNNALITDVSQHFDFINCNITYNINAISVGATVAASKHTFPAYNGKASDKIREMLWGSENSDLIKLFPGMKNQLEVERKGLIPTNDKQIFIGEHKNITTLAYLNVLINRMVSSSTPSGSNINDSVYMYSVSDSSKGSSFKIVEVRNLKSSNIKNIPYIYEVNVGYPDDNFVLNFSVNTNFAWALAYESSKDIIKYDYNLDSIGNLEKQRIPACYKNEKDELGNRNLWTSLTRYPVNATLTVRGLTQNSLLMQYIKINNYMYGAKRITSGIYIVTEQIDSIGNGVYTTTFNLMRVSGDDEYLILDGRKMV